MLSKTINDKICEAFNDIPILNTQEGRNTLLVRAGLDVQLRSQIKTEGAVATFLPGAINILSQYGIMQDGRDALTALLEAARDYVGTGSRNLIEQIIKEWAEIKNNPVWPLEVETYLLSLIQKWEKIESALLPQEVRFSQIAARLKTIRLNDPSSNNDIRYSKSILEKEIELPLILNQFPEINRWIVLGDPGSGKTTFLIREAFELASQAIHDPASPIPVWIPLWDFSRQIDSSPGYSLYKFIDALGESVLVESLGKIIQRYAKLGRIIFLLDGLDETADQLRGKLQEAINVAVYPGLKNKTIITSRKVGFTGFKDYVKLEISPLHLNEQRKIMLAICGPEKTQRLLAELSGRPELREMASIPMMVNVLALVAREATDFSAEYFHRYSNLFRFASMMLLESKHRNDGAVRSPYNAEKILSALSLLLHGSLNEEKSEEIFTLTEIERNIMKIDRELLSPWKGPRDFVDDVSKRSNIIYPIGSFSQKYKYLHRTFREFFAALELSNLTTEDREDFVREAIDRQNWSEVLVILGGLVEDVDDYLRLLLGGSPDLALRAIKEVDSLDPQVATEILNLRPMRLQSRRQVFIELIRKLKSPGRIVDVLWAYLKSTKERIPRYDLYFIQEALKVCNSDLANNLSKEIFKYLPVVPLDIFERESEMLGEKSYWSKIQKGPFTFGAEKDDPSRPEWVPVYGTINLSEYSIGKFPVTNAMYELFDPMHKELRDFADQIDENELAYHPVVKVSWYEAEIFCNWISQSFDGIRLPTEYEWEKAASWNGSSKNKFPWGNTWNPDLLNNWESGPNRTTKVNAYPDGRSPYGVYDMAGNVWEWCLDWFTDNFEELKPFDPIGPNIGDRKIDRGGGWYHDVGLPFTFLRAADDPGDIFSHCGFRVVRSSVVQNRGADFSNNETIPKGV